MPGTNKNKNIEEFIGKICSFLINFKPSIKACKTPLKLTTVGPIRFWDKPNKWRSYNVIKAIACKTQTTNKTSIKILFKIKSKFFSFTD